MMAVEQKRVFRSLCCTLCQFTCLHATYRLHRGEEKREAEELLQWKEGRRWERSGSGRKNDTSGDEGGLKEGGGRAGTEGKVISDTNSTVN